MKNIVESVVESTMHCNVDIVEFVETHDTPTTKIEYFVHIINLPDTSLTPFSKILQISHHLVQYCRIF